MPLRVGNGVWSVCGHGLLAVATVVALSGGPTAWAAEASPALAAARLSFNRDIRPILSENCFACHGPDHARREAGLRLDRFDDATRELDSGARAIAPDAIEASELLVRVTSTDPDTMMPPPEAKLGQLTPGQIETLRRWIAEGAPYEPHWAFVAPRRPSDAPDQESDEIDALVERTLADRGLTLQPEADRATLIRRASFDITGLPPTPDEMEAFVADPSADAYERLLDRLLASPRYGERMTADWLDIARYSDSYGFQVDRPRPTMWPWRDWVISAFNRNLPWDEFVTWQLAGDLLPGATDEQRLATAFNRLHQHEAEGGSVEEEYRVAYVNDRVTTFGTAFLGLSLECCRCHDHKFDPLSQRDFYSLFAFFDDIDEAGLYSYFTQSVPTPTMRLPDERQAAALAAAEKACDAAAAVLSDREREIADTVATWLSGRGPEPGGLSNALAARSPPGEVAHYAFDERRDDGRFDNLVSTAPAAAHDDAPHDAADTVDEIDVGADPDAKSKRATRPDGSASSPPENILVDGRFGRAMRLTGDHPIDTPVGNFRRSQPFSVAMWVHAAEPYDRAVVFHRSRAWTDAGSRGYELLVDEGKLRWSLIHFWPGDAASIRTSEPLPVNTWTHVAVTSDGSGRAGGLAVFVNGRPAAVEVVRDTLSREITGGGGDTITIGQRMRDHGFKDGLVDEVRVFDRALAPIEVEQLIDPDAIQRAVNERHGAESLAAWLSHGADTLAAAARAALQHARRDRDDLAEKPAEIMVMRDLPTPKTAYVLGRGDYDKRGVEVAPDTPAILPPFPEDQPRTRLGLARWLVAPDHPLLARVTVNRLWQALFGVGLVPTSEELGSQSTQPEHPAVLDALAWRLSHPVAEGGFGWDMKRLIKTIMMSRTYRQQSMADAKTMADDPLNTWLARGPRHRLPAEMIRDGLLAASGLLVERVGGPPVKTYDMPDSFKPEKADTGDALYRRSLYTFWRRTGPAPVLEAFDVPKRVVCVARRDTTNTPLHALVLLNATQFVEAARVLAERLLVESAGDPAAVLDAAFVRLTGRHPDSEERQILARMHGDQRAWYRGRPDDAKALVSVGATPRDGALDAVEVAAAASVINALMNHDGSVVKR